MVNKVLPREIYDFFSSDVGRSLIVKGHAGTGKTILSLTLLEEIADIENSFYFSTRVSNKSLYSQFQWLKEKDMRENLVDSSMDFLRSLYKDKTSKLTKTKAFASGDEKFEKIEHARRVIDVMGDKPPEEFTPPEEVSRSCLMTLMADSDITALEDIYDRVDSRLPSPSIVIIDSLESLIERYAVDATSLIKVLQRDLVEMSGTKLIIVLEAEEATTWDYLVDGVVTLSVDEQSGRRVRLMSLNKLRGIRIDRPMYLFTLDGGKFRYSPSFSQNIPLFQKEHDPILDGEGTSYWDRDLFSSGSKEFDDILGGGYPHGSLVLIEVSHDVPLAGQMKLFGPVLENFLSQERGVLLVPSSRDKNIFGESSSIFSEDMEDNLKVIDSKELKRHKKGDFKHSFHEAYKELKFKANEPILTICDWVTIEHSIGDAEIGEIDRSKAAKELLELMKKNSGLTIGVMGPGFFYSDNARYVSDIHLKMFTYYNSLFVYGEKPNTEIYNITVERDDHPRVKFVKQV